MNNARRKKINNIVAQIEAAMQEANGILDEEQDYYDNMPESFQDSERGEIAQEAIDNLESAIENLEEAIDSLNDAAT